MDDLDLWFDETWKKLPTYLFTSQTKGSRKMALDELKKVKPTIETLGAIRAWVESKEAIDVELRKSGTFVASWPHFHRMIKRQFWQDDLPVIKQKKRSMDQSNCACGAAIDHSASRLCWACYDKRYGNSLCGHT